jgi:hypothetical protein
LPTSTQGKNIEIRTKVVGVYDKGKASVVETETTVVDKVTEEVYSKALGSAFFVGQGGWGGPKGKFYLSLYQETCTDAKIPAFRPQHGELSSPSGQEARRRVC